MESNSRPVAKNIESSDPVTEEQLCEEFQAAWLADENPRCEAFLERVPSEQRPQLLERLLIIEFAALQRIGKTPSPDDYQHRFETLTSFVNKAWNAISPSHPGNLVRCPHCLHELSSSIQLEGDRVSCDSCGASFQVACDETFDASSNPVSVPTTSSGTHFAHFHLQERVGSGAFGTVFKARDLKLDRIVAIKIPSHGLMDENETIRFVREARAAAQLSHPNIVHVYEIGQEQERAFIVSDFIDGQTLGDFLHMTHLSPLEAAQMCITLGGALAHAHQRGVIHRDLKPNNIMIDRQGNLYIMDFGLAKRKAGDDVMSTEGRIIGSPAYMPPEQARGDSHQADGRSDLYSTGVILYEMLTGERPFRGTTQVVLHQILTVDAPSPRKLNPMIPLDLETICLKCLEKDPAKRFANASDLVDELRRFVSGQPILSRPITQVERGWRWCRRNPVVATLTSLVVLVTLVGITTTIWQYQRAIQQLEFTRLENRRANNNLSRASRVVHQFTTEVANSRELLRDSPGTQLLRTRLLGLAKSFYEEFLTDNQSAEQLPELLAHSQLQLSVATAEIGDQSEALREAEAALNAFRALTKDQRSADGLDGLAAATQQVGYLHQRQGRLEDAHKYFSECLVVRRQLSHDSPLWHSATSRALVNLGNTEEERGDHNAALASFQEAAEVASTGLLREQEGEGRDELLLSFASALDGQARVELLSNREDDAIQTLTRGLKVLDENQGLTLNAPKLGLVHLALSNNLSASLIKAGKSEGALSQLTSSIELGEKLAYANPTVPKVGIELVRSYIQAGVVQHMLTPSGDESVNRLTSAINTATSIVAMSPNNHEAKRVQAEAELNLANILLQKAPAPAGVTALFQRRDSDNGAESHAQRAFDLSRALVEEAPQSAETWETYLKAGLLKIAMYDLRKRYDDGKQVCEAVFEFAKENGGVTCLPPRTQVLFAEVQRYMGIFHVKTQSRQEGIKYFRSARRIVTECRVRDGGSDENARSWLLSALGELQLFDLEAASAPEQQLILELCELAIEVTSDLENSEEQERFRFTIAKHFTLTGFGYAWKLATAYDEKERDAERSLALSKRMLELNEGQDKNRLIVLMDCKATALAACGDFEQAIAGLDQALAMFPSQVLDPGLKELESAMRERRAMFAQHMPYVSQPEESSGHK